MTKETDLELRIAPDGSYFVQLTYDQDNHDPWNFLPDNPYA